MNTLISLILSAALIASIFWSSKTADTGARFGMRLYGTIFALGYLGFALVFSWWLALVGLILLFAGILFWSRR